MNSITFYLILFDSIRFYWILLDFLHLRTHTQAHTSTHDGKVEKILTKRGGLKLKNIVISWKWVQWVGGIMAEMFAESNS